RNLSSYRHAGSGRHLVEMIEYLVEENRVLKEQMRGRALRLNDDQRRRLAAKAKLLDRRRRGCSSQTGAAPTPCARDGLRAPRRGPRPSLPPEPRDRVGPAWGGSGRPARDGDAVVPGQVGGLKVVEGTSLRTARCPRIRGSSDSAAESRR